MIGLRSRRADLAAVGPSARRRTAPADPADRLLGEVANGDREAFAALFDLVAPDLLGLVRSSVDGERLADDIVARTFVDLWRLAPTMDLATTRCRRWLERTAHRDAMGATATLRA